MYSRPLGTPADELKHAEHLLKNRNERLTAELEAKGKPELVYKPDSLSLGGGGHAKVSGQDRGAELEKEHRAELKRLEEIARTEDLQGRTGAQIARDAMAKRVEPVQRTQAFESPSREFKADARQPSHFDQHRLEIEKEAELDDPPARAFRQQLAENRELEREREKQRELERTRERER